RAGRVARSCRPEGPQDSIEIELRRRQVAHEDVRDAVRVAGDEIRRPRREQEMARVARECGTDAYPAGVVSLTVHAEADKLRPVRAQVSDEDVRDVVAVVRDEIRRERGEGDVACVQAEARAAEALGVRLT